MKFSIFFSSTIATTWHLESTIKSLKTVENINYLQGTVLGSWSDAMIPCIFWTNDVPQKFSFTHLYESFPLQVTETAIFFWTTGPNFSLKIESTQKLDILNSKIFCGDLSDILGAETIEDENAEKVRISSFPSGKNDLITQGRFLINRNYKVQDNDVIRLTFPYQTSPDNLYAMRAGLEVTHKNGKRVWEFRGNFEDTVEFMIEYKKGMIVPSYEMIVEVISDDLPISLARRKL